MNQIKQELTEAIEKRAGTAVRRLARRIQAAGGPACRTKEIDEATARLFVEAEDRQAAALAAWAVRRRIRRQRWNGLSIRIGYRARARRARQTAAAMGTNGVVETARLRAAEKMGDERTWAAAVALGGLHEIGRWTAVRGTKEARATAALLEAGRPLTTDEIGAAVGIGDPKETRVLLGNRKAFRKTSKTRWALTAWKLPRYEGVVREAERRIKAGGGRVERSELIRDLEATTEAARSTIARYLAARRFHTADGWVELAGRDGRSRSNIEEEADGIDGDGNPYRIWTRPGRKTSTLRVHVHGVGDAVAEHAGVGPERTETLEVVEPPECGVVSMTRYLHQPGGAVVGRLRKVLEALGTRPGDRLRVTFLGERRIRFEATEEHRRAPTNGRRRKGTLQDVRPTKR